MRVTVFNPRHPDCLFELKYDGFRALAYAQDGGCRLISMSANAYKAFRQLGAAIARFCGGTRPFWILRSVLRPAGAVILQNPINLKYG